MPEVIFFEGGRFSDKRGILSFVNDFDFSDVRRFYNITHPDVSVVRAWQGHKIERKYFYVPYGSFLLAWVKIDNWEHPSSDLKASYTILSSEKPGVLSIPAGYANGIKAIIPDSVLTVYSNLDLKESENDRWTFDQALWFNWSQY